MLSKLRTGLLLLICFVVRVPAGAQTTGWHRFNFNVGGGFTSPTGDAGDRLDTGANVAVGGGYNFTPEISVLLEYQYNWFGLNRQALTALQEPDGNTRVWSLTLNPRYIFNPHSRFQFYAIGGYGVYNRRVQFTQPTIASGIVCDPFWGFCYSALVPAHIVLGEFETTKGGVNGGGGISFGFSDGAKIYAEARVHRMFTSNRATVIVPVTFGLRW